MRSFYVLFLLLQIQYVIIAQAPLANDFNTSKDLASGEQDVGEFACILDGKILVRSSLYSWEDNSRGVINSLWDTTGQFITKKMFYDTSYRTLHIFKSIEIDHRVVYGVGYAQKRNDTINDLDLYFTKYNADGDTIFSKIFKDTGSVVGYDIIRLKPDLFALLGQAAHDYQNPLKLRTVITLIDSSGNFLKESFSPPGNYRGYLLNYDPAKKEYYVLGVIMKPDSPVYTYLQTYDSTFNIKFTKNDLAGPEGYVYSSRFYKGSLYCSFSKLVNIPPIPFPGNQINILKFTIKNQTLVQKATFVISPPDTVGDASCGNFILDNDKLIFVSFNSHTRFTMHFCDTMLTEICRAQISGPGSVIDYWSSTISLTESKKLLIPGTLLDFSQTQANSKFNTWISMSGDYRNHISNFCDYTGIPKLDHGMAMRVYPNPCEDYLNISETPVTSGRNSKITVYDQKGKTCITQITDLASENIINVSQLSPGIYYLQVKDDLEIWSKKFIKK